MTPDASAVRLQPLCVQISARSSSSARRRQASASQQRSQRCLVLAQGIMSAEDAAQAAQFKTLNGVGNARSLGVEVQVPRLEAQEWVASPFCTFSACALPATPRTGPRNALNLHHAFVSDDDRVLLKSISYGNATSAGAEDCDADCNFTPRWYAPLTASVRGLCNVGRRTRCTCRCKSVRLNGSAKLVCRLQK
jgi:hypothetical protein